jgi:hypothetical protein
MKKLLSIAALLAVALSASAQGTIQFVNRIPGTLDAPVFDVDGVTRLGGSGYQAQLYVGTSANNLQAVGSPVPFRTGAAAGYINSSDVSVPGIAGGASAFVAMRAWSTASGATYEAAGIKGSSQVLSITLGGAGSPPSTPALLTGLQQFSLVPEPSTIALAVLGGIALLFRRRK